MPREKAIAFFIMLVTITSLANTENTVNHISKQIRQKMESDGIVPNTLDEAPSAKITLIYPDGIEVEFGQELTPTQVKDQPEVKWDADPDKFYTLIMFDPDAPTRDGPVFANVKHWLVVNIPGSDVGSGEIIAEYFGSGPPKGTGLHRYIFLVWIQPGQLDFSQEPRSEKLSRQHRLKFSIKDFNRKYNLGKPFAGNYFNAQWDSYVDERNKFVTGQLA